MEADWTEAELNYILLQFKQHKLRAGIRKYSKVLSFGIRKIFFYALKQIPYQNSDLFVGVIFQIGAWERTASISASSFPLSTRLLTVVRDCRYDFAGFSQQWHAGMS